MLDSHQFVTRRAARRSARLEPGQGLDGRRALLAQSLDELHSERER